MGLRAWSEKIAYIRKGAPERQKGFKSIRKGAPERQKDLKEQTQKNKKQNKGSPGKKCKRIGVFGRKLRKDIGAPDFGA